MYLVLSVGIHKTIVGMASMRNNRELGQARITHVNTCGRQAEIRVCRSAASNVAHGKTCLRVTQLCSVRISIVHFDMACSAGTPVPKAVLLPNSSKRGRRHHCPVHNLVQLWGPAANPCRVKESTSPWTAPAHPCRQQAYTSQEKALAPQSRLDIDNSMV